MSAPAAPVSAAPAAPAPEAAPAPGGWMADLRASLQTVANPEAAESSAEAPAEEPKAPKETKAPKVEAKPAGKLTAADLAKREASIKAAAEKRAVAAERQAAVNEIQLGKEADAIRKNVKNDPWAALKWLGIKPEEFTAALADKGEMTEERKAVLAMQARLDAREQQEAQAREAAMVNQARNTVQQFLSKDDRFEITRSQPNGADTVLAVMNQHWEATKDPTTGQGEYMDPNEAADLVEKYFESELDKLAQVAKVKKRLGAAEPSKSVTPQGTRQPPRTISSRVTSQTAPAPSEVSDAERKQWLAEELKKRFRM